MSRNDLLSAWNGLGNPRALVLGDLILDRYCWGDAERISQEAPVIVLRADRREARLGGAANVCRMLRGLGARVSIASALGGDSEAQAVRDLLSEADIDCGCLVDDPARPTTVKERFIGRAAGKHPHQILRVDREVRDPLPSNTSDELIARLVDAVPRHDVVLISDYDKGVCSRPVLRAVIEAARSRGVPVIVDPRRGGDFSRYRGATTMTPNRLEAELATESKIRTKQDAVAAGKQLCGELDLQMAIVTLDRDGMALVWPDGRGEIYPTQVRSLYDITGAGDMVLATIGVCLAERIAPDVAVQLGNVAAGLEVEHVGVAVIPRDEIRARLQADALSFQGKIVTVAECAARLEAHRRRGETIVFTNGCFDLLHVGHVTYLEQAAALGSTLVVGVNSDASVRKLKGPTRPVISQGDRASMLAALGCVDYVLVFDEDTPHALLHALRPDVLVKGGTYTAEQVVGREVVEKHGGRACVVGVIPGVSTTNILASLQNTQDQAGNQLPRQERTGESSLGERAATAPRRDAA